MSPILLDLDSNGFHLVGLEEGVDFDMDGDGVVERLGWTRGDQLDAFLCNDRNGNGLIDDGTELFGNFTPLAGGGRAANGYLAVRELDTPALGGNGDGYLNEADSGFHALCLWIDLDHDGATDEGELTSLTEMGVLEVEHEYTVTRRRDRHGNLFALKSRGWMEGSGGSERRLQTYDVFFVKE